jgi:hypothetical protein
MSLAIATKGVLVDYYPTGQGGQTVYVLEEFNVEVSHEDVNVLVSVMDSISLNITETMISIDLDEDQAQIITSEDDTIDIEV